MRIFLCAFLILAACSPEEQMRPKVIRPVRAFQVEQPQLIETYAFPGRTRAADRVNLSFRVSGPLIELPIRVGDGVKEGKLLAKIDPRDFESEVRKAEATVERTRAELTFAKNDSDRAERIYKEDPGAISQSQLDQKREEKNRLQAELERYESELESAKDRLKDTSMLAPYDGVITARFVENFEQVQAKQAILRLLGRDRMEMVVDVPENFMQVISRQPDVVIRLDALPGKKIPAKIKEVGLEASASTRTFPITLSFQVKGEIQMLAGMVGEAVFSAKDPVSDEKGYAIPITALFSYDDQDNVWVVNTNTMKVKQRKVKKKKLMGAGKVLVTGVKTGDWVITAGTHFLHEGQEVKFFD